ncbi:MAG: hypothetical protein GY850_35710, partial [bacterium]|nr:hypothetical protein [bacterium]
DYGTAVQSIIHNSIIWNNSDDLINATATQSDIGDGDAGAGNISSDPLFVDDTNADLDLRDYHLLATSPCVDTGRNLPIAKPREDIDGESRIMDGDENGTYKMDMGADEVTGPVNPGGCSTVDSEMPIGMNLPATLLPYLLITAFILITKKHALIKKKHL